MLTPSIFGKGFFDDFNDFWNMEPAIRTQTSAARKMSTDVKELNDGYEIDMELPGIKKEDVTVELKDGYLTVSAQNKSDNKTEENGKYIRQERYYGKYQRSFFVGDEIDKADVKAKFENGILELKVPKKEPKQPEHQYISIE